MNSTIMKVAAWGYLIFGVIGSLTMGGMVNGVARDGGTLVTIIGIISTVFFAIILFAIAKILEHSEYTVAKINAMEREARKTNAPEAPAGASNSKMSLSDIASKSTGNEWRCPKCGKTNPTSSRVCKDCGYQK